MTTSLRRGRQLLALALASTTVVVAAGASAASAAPTGTSTTTSLYSGSADSSALQLVLTLPSALSAVTGAVGSVLPNPIDLSLIRSTGQVSHTGTSPDVSTSVEDLAQSSLFSSSLLGSTLTGVLQHTVTSSLGTPSPSPYNVLSLPSNPLGLNLNVGPLTASTNTGDKSNQAGGAVGVGNLGSLASLAPSIVPTLQSTLGTVTSGLTTATTALGGVTTTATSTVLSAAAPILAALPVLTIPTSSLIAGAPDITVSAASLTNVINSLGTTITTTIPALLTAVENDLLNGPLLSLNGVTTGESVTPSGTGTTSTGSSNTGDINLLGGLIQITASKATATASSPGTAGKAAASATATLLKVQLGDDATKLLDLLATDQGLTAQLLPNSALGQSLLGASSTASQAVGVVNSGLAAALGAVQGLLTSLGSGAQILQQGTATQSVSPDGTHAEAHATPAQVKIGITGVADNLLALSLGKVDVVANRENSTTTPVSAPGTIALKAPTVAKVPGQPSTPVAPTKKLAYTGADLPLTAGAALLLLGTATALTRRRRRNSSI